MMQLQEITAAHVGTDVKAEVVAADLVEAGAEIDDMVITPVGIAGRSFSRDIVKMDARQDKQGLRDLLFIEVSREGLYHALPESIFHVFEKGKRNSSARFVEEYKKHKAEEEYARQFFLAFEKEINRLRISIEINERRSIMGFSEQFRSGLFVHLWPELQEVSYKYLPALVMVLPVAHKVIGDTQTVAMLLSYIVDKPVEISLNDSAKPFTHHTRHNLLGENYLGINCIIGNEVPDFTPAVNINVGPVKKSEIILFMPGGDAEKALSLACKYLFPVTADINVYTLLDNVDEKLILSDEKGEAILGHTSRI